MPALLGIYGRKEYYLSDPDPKTGEQQIVWRVPDIREAVRARPGWKLLGADYSQIEIRLMADASEDPWLIQALNSGKDVHCYLTADAYGISYDEFFYGYKHENDPNHWQFCTMRNDFKQVSFGVPYGAKAPLIAAKTGKPLDEAQALIDRFFGKARVLKVWLDDQGRMAIRYGFSSSSRGRKRFYRIPALSDPEREAKLAQIERWAGNQPIQSGCCDLLKPAMYRIYLRLRGGDWAAPPRYGARILFCVHDEIVTTAPDAHVSEVSEIMKVCMQAAYDDVIKSVKNTVDVTIGDYWKK